MSSVSKNKGVGRQFATSIGLTYDEWDLVCGLLGRTANEYEALFFAVLWGEEISRKSTQAFFHRARRMSEEQSLKYRPGRGAQRILGDRVLAYSTSGDSRFSYLDPALGVRITLQQSLLELATLGAAPLGFSQLIRSGYPDRSDNQIFLRDLFSGVEFFSQSTGTPLVDVDLEFEKDFEAGVIVSSYFFGWGNEASLKDGLAASSGDILLLLGEKSRPAIPSITRQEKLTSDVDSVLLRSSNPFYSSRLAGAVRELVADGTTPQPVVVRAGGIMRAVLELCSRADRVVRVDVERMPRADSQMHARELLLSESGNRVVFIMSKDAYAASTATLRKWKVDATVIGEVIDGEGVQFCWNHRTVADIPLKRFLATDVKREFELVEFPPMVKPTHKIRNRLPQVEKQERRRSAVIVEDEGKASFSVPEYLPDAWIDMLADPNLCSRRYLGNIIQSPEYIRSVAGERDAHVFPDWTKLGQDTSAPIPGVATALVGESLYMKSDAYLGTVHAVAEALRRLAAVGAKPSALVGALSFGDPSKYRHLCDLAEATRALSDVGRVWGLSLLTENLNLAIGVHGGGDLPTPGILAVGEVSDCRVSVPGGFVTDGDVVLVLGTTANEIACSEYARYYKHDLSSIIPELNFSSEENVRSVLLTLVSKGLLQSAHSVGKGGIAVALAECCLIRPEEPIGANLFLALTFDPREYRADAVLFSETPGRFIVSCKKEHQAEIEKICKQSSITISGKGDVGGRKIVMEGAVDLSLPLTTALKVWTNRLRNILNPA